MSSAAGAEVDPSVCYRHPTRSSWTLCERCGRTICPECQILTPQGVRCPDCVRETGGSVQWTPVGSAQKAAAVRAAKVERDRVAAQRAARRPRWQQVTLDFIRPGGTLPIVTWTMAAVTIAIWIVGFFTANLPFTLLAVSIAHSEWVWTYVTSAFVYPAIPAVSVILSFALNILFLVWLGPQRERRFSRGRFLAIFFAGTAVAGALAVLVGSYNYGLFAGIFALFAAYVVTIWDDSRARNQMLIWIAIYLVVALVFGSFLAVLGGLAAGFGAGFLFRRSDAATRTAARTPYLLLFAAVAVLVILAIVRGVLTVGV